MDNINNVFCKLYIYIYIYRITKSNNICTSWSVALCVPFQNILIDSNMHILLSCAWESKHLEENSKYVRRRIPARSQSRRLVVVSSLIRSSIESEWGKREFHEWNKKHLTVNGRWPIATLFVCINVVLLYLSFIWNWIEATPIKIDRE